LIDDFLNKTGDHCFILRCHAIPFQLTSGTFSIV
jgi:hypothetical protein